VDYKVSVSDPNRENRSLTPIYYSVDVRAQP
jgi:hypothetical protein